MALLIQFIGILLIYAVGSNTAERVSSLFSSTGNWTGKSATQFVSRAQSGQCKEQEILSNAQGGEGKKLKKRPSVIHSVQTIMSGQLRQFLGSTI